MRLDPFRGQGRLPRFVVVLTLSASGLAASANPASALSLGVGTGTSLSPFQPGHTAIGTGSLTVVDLSLGWTLTVKDNGAGAGHMVAAAADCTGSDAQLANALTVSVTGLGVTSAGAKTISATATTVASGPITAGLGLTTSYSQLIPAGQVMLTSCAYTMTATYTLQ